MTANALSLSDDDLAGLGLSTGQIADCIEEALIRATNGAFWSAPKSAVQPGDGRYIMATLSASDDPGLVVVKSVILNPRNPDRGLETINGAIMILDSETGLLKCVMGANWVTAVRTAGLSAVAARRLANPPSRSVAFIGCGVQARSHLDVFCDMYPLTEIRAFGRGRANVDRLCDHARTKGLTATASDSAQQAVTGADIIVTSITATFDGEPFLDARWLKHGAFAAITDLGKPWQANTMSGFGTILIDDHAQEAAMPTPMVAPDLITADLTQAVTSQVPVGFDPGKSSAFIFRGIAVGDFAVAALAYETACQR